MTEEPEEQYVEPVKEPETWNEIKVHKVANWYDSESEDVIIPQCGDRSFSGWREIDGLLPTHSKCKKCFSESYQERYKQE